MNLLKTIFFRRGRMFFFEAVVKKLKKRVKNQTFLFKSFSGIFFLRFLCCDISSLNSWLTVTSFSEHRKNEWTNERTNEQTKERKKERKKRNRCTDRKKEGHFGTKNGSPLNPAFQLFNFHLKCQLLASHLAWNWIN
jgi:hypothetical protein